MEARMTTGQPIAQIGFTMRQRMGCGLLSTPGWGGKKPLAYMVFHRIWTKTIYNGCYYLLYSISTFYGADICVSGVDIYAESAFEILGYLGDDPKPRSLLRYLVCKCYSVVLDRTLCSVSLNKNMHDRIGCLVGDKVVVVGRDGSILDSRCKMPGKEARFQRT